MAGSIQKVLGSTKEGPRKGWKETETYGRRQKESEAQRSIQLVLGKYIARYDVIAEWKSRQSRSEKISVT